MAQAATQASEGRSIPTLEALYQESARLNTTPGWLPRDTPILWEEPRSKFVPNVWKYTDIRHALLAAGELIDVALAERRNLVLRNPFPGNNFETTRTFACAYQMIKPGEIAPTHRHAPHALRVIIDAKKVYSVVNGDKTPMESGDVVLTPGWHWHGHGHEGDETAYWFDGLDVPTTHLLEPMYYQEHPDRYESVARVTAKSPFRFSREDMASRLDKEKADPSGLFGPRIALDAPTMPTMQLTMERQPVGFVSRRCRSTANRVYVVLEGEGVTTAGNNELRWTRGDTFVVPTWNWFSHRATRDAQLFCMSDEPLMKFANYFRSEVESDS